MKKIRFIALFVAFVLTFSIQAPTLAYSDEYPTYEVNIDPYDIDDVEDVIAFYNVRDEAAADMLAFAEKCISGEIVNGTLTLETFVNPLARATRTYTGYNNWQYYEETVTINGTSAFQTVYTTTASAYSAYLSTSISAAIRYMVDAVLDEVSGGSWGVASLLVSTLPSGIPSSTSIQHQASLYETKTRKYTYAVQDGQYYYPAVADKTTYYFDNLRAIPGSGPYSGTQAGQPTTTKTATTSSYNNGDQKAYVYMYSGYTDYVSAYTYKGKVFNSVS
jgi:hypothetical protein